jgi:hypothetical protein
MLRFIKLESADGKRVDFVDLSHIVYVREVNDTAAKGEQGLEVEVHFAGGAVARLRGPEAGAFLRQFTAYADRLNLQPGGPGPSGPGLSALSP